jgi:hypothetical protein
VTLRIDTELGFLIESFLVEHQEIKNTSALVRTAVKKYLAEASQKPAENEVSTRPTNVSHRPNRAPKHPTLQEQWAAELRQENERRIQQALEPEHLDHQTQNWLRGR